MISEIHILHHTHTDLGYTDLPTTCLDLHVGYLRQAMDAAEATSMRSEASKFRWTCEVMGAVDEFLTRYPGERQRLITLIRSGQIEVCALPWNLSTHLTCDEWERLRGLYRPMWKEFGSTCAMQNDVNGLSWGMIPGLLEDGIKGLVMGPNPYSGGSPLPYSTPFLWEGPDGGKLVVWISGGGYCEAYSWFHEEQWRRGPVPRAVDPWFSRPADGDIWDPSPQGLGTAYERLHAVMEGTLGDYRYGTIACQLTNQWRMDNDPPYPGISDFVEAWNNAGLEPRLILSTPRMFFDALDAEVGDGLPVVRGDWTDWWADALPSLAPELALGQRAKAGLARLPLLAKALGKEEPDLDALWKRSLVWTEHTFASYESVAYPWRETTRGQDAQLLSQVYRLWEDMQMVEGNLLRTAGDYVHPRRAAAVGILDPLGFGGGWVEIPGQALGDGVTGLVDPKSGKRYPFEVEAGAEWGGSGTVKEKPLMVPDDVWDFTVIKRRAWIPTDSAQTRLVIDEGPNPAPPGYGDQGSDGHWRWVWDPSRGCLESLVHVASGREMLDPESPWPFASLIWDRVTGDMPWTLLDSRTGVEQRIRREIPPPVDARLIPGHYGFHARWRREHPDWYTCQQDLRLLPDGNIEIVSDIWMKEHLVPVGLWLCLPMSGQGVPVRYDALGWPTRIGRDQMPMACGEHVTAGRWLAVDYPEISLCLDCCDTPVVAVDGIKTRSGALAGEPLRPHIMPCLLSTTWSTNFPHCRSQHIRTRHLLKAMPPNGVPKANWSLPLSCYPVS